MIAGDTFLASGPDHSNIKVAMTCAGKHEQGDFTLVLHQRVSRRSFGTDCKYPADVDRQCFLEKSILAALMPEFV